MAAAPTLTSVVDKSKLTQVEDEIFWKKVREGYNIVAANNEKTIEFTTNRRNVVIRIAKDGSGKIVMHFEEASPDVVTLVVPPGGSDKE